MSRDRSRFDIYVFGLVIFRPIGNPRAHSISTFANITRLLYNWLVTVRPIVILMVSCKIKTIMSVRKINSGAENVRFPEQLGTSGYKYMYDTFSMCS